MGNSYTQSVMPIHPAFIKKRMEDNTTFLKNPLRFAGGNYEYQYLEENDGQMWQRKMNTEDLSLGEWEKVNQPYRFTETGFLVHG